MKKNYLHVLKQISFALSLKLDSVISPYYQEISPRFVFEQKKKEGEDVVMKEVGSSAMPIKEMSSAVTNVREVTSLAGLIPTDILTNVVFPILRHLNIFLCRTPILFNKLCKVLREFCKQVCQNTNQTYRGFRM